MADETLAAFMDATGCGYDDSFRRLASCGGHLGRAVSRFFNVEAGPSGSRRSPPPPSRVEEVSSDTDGDDAPAPAPAARSERRARERSPPSCSSPKAVSKSKRRDGEARGGGGSKSSRRRRRRRRRDREAGGGENSRGEKKRRRVREDDVPSRGGREEAGGGRKSSRRRRRSRDNSDSEEKAEANNRSLRRRRLLNPKDPTSDSDKEEDGSNSTLRRRLPEDISSDGDKKVRASDSSSCRLLEHISSDSDGDKKQVQANDSGRRRLDRGNVPAPDGGGGKKEDAGPRFRENIFSSSSSSDDDGDMVVYEAPPPPRPANSRRTVEGLFQAPRELTYKGGFHDAMAHAARRARWLLVNVQRGLEFASLVQNRDVWGSDMVAQWVRGSFVLWQADADARGGEREEAEKVLGYYKVPRDRLPVVVVVDPVTGQAVDRLHGADPNDFLVAMGPYTDKAPAMPVVGAKKPGATPGAQTNQKPATTTAPTVRKPAEAAVAVAPPPGQARREQTAAVRKPAEPVATAVAEVPTGQQPAATAAKVCKLRVRLPDGRVVAKEFGSQCAVAELFAHCRSELGEAAEKRPFRLLRFVGAARQEIGDERASFESLRLHMSTVCVELG